MSTFKHKIAIEPLSRAGWDRVESKLFASLDQGEHLAPPPAEDGARKLFRLRVGGLATAVAAAAAALLFLKGYPGSQEPPVADRELAPASAPGPQPQASAQAFLADGSRIETTTAPVQSTIGDSILDIADHSSLRVSGNDEQGWLVDLDSGRVDCRVAPRRGRPPFAVQAGETRVTVVGTRFSVERRDEGARVVVQEGIVRVQSREQSVLLSPGQSWSVDAVPEPAAPAQRPARRPAAAETSAEQRRFERAAHLEATDPQAALRIYRELDRHGAWSANALYARGRLELASGQPRGRQDLRLYLKRYPKGPNAEDVRALLRQADGASGEASSH